MPPRKKPTEPGVENHGDAADPLADGAPETRLEELVGCSGYSGPARTLEEMEEGIVRGARTATLLART